MNAKNYMSTLKKIKGQYVDWLDVPQAPNKNGDIPTNQVTGKPYTTCKLFKVFASKAEAQAAYDALGVGSNNGSSGGQTDTFYPASWTKTPAGVSQMIAYAKSLEITDVKELANKLGLFAEVKEDGSQLTINDVAHIILEVTDAPLPVSGIEQALK